MDFDTSVRPTDDFFQYVNGGWIKNNPIPPDEAQWGSFTILRVQVEGQLKAILDELMAHADLPQGSVGQKVRDFYRTGMNLDDLNRLRAEPLKELFAMVAAFEDKKDLPRIVARLHEVGAWAFWTPFADQDEKKSDVMALHLYQGGLSLPDRDYYLKDDEKSREIRKKYEHYIAALLECSGTDAAVRENSVRTILEIETRLAQSSRTRVELRDIHKQYNKMSPADLAARTPDFFWPNYFAALSLASPEYSIVGQPEFFEEVNRVIGEFGIDEIKTYLSWHILNAMAKYLSEDFEQLSFDFYGRTFGGATEMKARWRRVLAVVNGLLDEALGELYVERHFSKDAKRKINVLVDNLIAAYRARIQRLDWMEDATKKKALQKLAKFSRKLGYPDKWKDISGLEVRDDSYAANFMRAHAFEFARQMGKVGKPVDRAEWLMPPQMVNAYYQPPMNEIVFPAAILQPPFFDSMAEDAVNYGGIGSVIGHELTHGFDDQGALFNAEGNLENWWAKEDKERFDLRTARLAAQFDAYEPLPGMHINGRLTLGENIADLGGLLIAYDALRLALGKKGDASAYQKFFINYAVTERNNQREEIMRLRIQTDPHSPSKYRVNGPLSNMQEFCDAFGAKERDNLWRKPEDRVRIW